MYCVLCDGMGGHKSGKVASQLAVRLISDFADQIVCPEAFGEEELIHEIEGWIERVNAVIFNQNSQKINAKDRMGTTLVFLGLFGDHVAIGHVGDSRAYRFRDNVLTQITADHSILSSEIDKSKLPERDRNRLKKRKYITRAIGTRKRVKPDVKLLKGESDDIFLLCTDGLTDMVADVEIEERLRRVGDDLPKFLDGLVATANRRGGNDNITVISGRLFEEEEDDDEITHF